MKAPNINPSIQIIFQESGAILIFVRLQASLKFKSIKNTLTDAQTQSREKTAG
jgi:hypothetical protein